MESLVFDLDDVAGPAESSTDPPDKPSPSAVSSPLLENGGVLDSPKTGKKKKSALSRLAEHKGKRKGMGQSDTESLSGSRASLNEKEDKGLTNTEDTDNREQLNGQADDNEMGSQSSLNSGRRKKKSALARLAAKKREGSNTSLRSDTAVEEDKNADVEMVIDDETWQGQHSQSDLLDESKGTPKAKSAKIPTPEDIFKDADEKELAELNQVNGDKPYIKTSTVNNQPVLGNSRFQPHPPETSNIQGTPQPARRRNLIPLSREAASDYESGGSMASVNSVGQTEGMALNPPQAAGTVDKALAPQPVDKEPESSSKFHDQLKERWSAEKEEEKEEEEVNKEETDSESELTEQYAKLLDNTPDKTDSKDSTLGFTPLKPPVGKNVLPPLRPTNTPPPLSKNMTSFSLKTSYKTDSPLRTGTLDGLSHQTSASTGILKMLSTAQLRERNFLIGGMTGATSLMGTSELDRHLVDRQVRVFVGTWNMAEQKGHPESIDDFLLPDNIMFAPEIYVIATQEMDTDRKAWEIKLQETLGPQFVLLHSAIHGSLHISLFLQRELIWYCSVCEEDRVTTRAFAMIKTKGAVVLSFTLFGTSFLFLGCHFHSDDDKEHDRVRDYNEISQGIALPRTVITNPYSMQKDATARFDCVFWCGDLNFRIDHPRENVVNLINTSAEDEHPNYEVLLSKDQLKRLQNEGLIFDHFQEGRICFPPTYKFDIGTDDYDTSPKQRIPSYTDRILFRSKKKNAISCLVYDSVQSFTFSDHKPVYGLYEVTIRPGRDNIALNAGLFNREVYLEANRRRGFHMDKARYQKKPPKPPAPKYGQKQSSICSIQ
ncbi:72 kDa inositol polyphosphate 5-phosphatase isoform X1 [Lingula anatina]|uniref:72 kDa inositol polyphosphate 5-phosphatase isoform X1 n=1 Tax=Lingula anatina TaxID=7574 RepID=A0A1S3JQP5_LINAN|nr:72 kDa inositol polyphosphate 5-phosphatase isoform X1 [Lingula anatina]|eukprot:XP_013412446.1 72 kDa inositol polyphosphate 5-phosphatase isoform X1 [Lingula anatina]